jgi:hypothetical protein
MEEGAELIDSVLDVVRKEAENCDCLQGTSLLIRSLHTHGRAHTHTYHQCKKNYTIIHTCEFKSSYDKSQTIFMI